MFDCLGECSMSVVKFGMAVFVLSGFQCGVRDLHSSWILTQLGFEVTDVLGQPVGPIFNVYYYPLPFHWNTMSVLYPPYISPHGHVSWIIQFTFPAS